MEDYCIFYLIADGDGRCEEEARNCPAYEFGDPDVPEDEEYMPSSTARDYGPSNPWDAPGMSVRDFI